MAVIPKQKNALWALAAGGALWAWQNRDKIQVYLKDSGVLDQIQGALNQGASKNSHQRTMTADATQSTPPSYSAPMTGETRRIGDMDMGGEFTNETKTKHDPSI